MSLWKQGLDHEHAQRRFMAIKNMSQDDQRYIFRPLQRTKNGERLRETGRLSDTCLRDHFNKNVAALGMNLACIV